MRILLTGFEPFGKLTANPSQHLLEQISAADFPAGTDLILERLPTAYLRGGQRIRELLEEHRPDLCICLGVAQNRQHVCLERIAVNLDDCSLPDNDGELAAGREIVNGDSLARRTALQLEQLLQESAGEAAMEYEGSPGPGIIISNHAGNFVCNHVYYSALQHIAKQELPTHCLFVHVPMTAECRSPGEHYTWELPTQAQLRRTILALAGRLARQVRPASETGRQ